MSIFKTPNQEDHFLGGETLILGVTFQKEKTTKPTNQVPNLQRFGVDTSDQTKPVTQRVHERCLGIINTFSSNK